MYVYMYIYTSNIYMYTHISKCVRTHQVVKRSVYVKIRL